jgi:hypothetical protein
MRFRRCTFTFGRILLGCSTMLCAVASAQTGACGVRSATQVPPVVELYTSEGCSSCPPADQWLSALKSNGDIVAMAFHVDYWDRLGWRDRFASPAFTQRQAREQEHNGADFSYTPQVVLDGADHKRWYRNAGLQPEPQSRPLATVQLALTRDGSRYTAVVTPTTGAPPKLAAYWTVTEDNHVTAVKAGENRGATLKHDYVVREYLPVAAWQAKGSVSLQYTVRSADDAAHPRHVNLVVIDASTGRPVQAVKLGC